MDGGQTTGLCRAGGWGTGATAVQAPWGLAVTTPEPSPDTR